jgi:oligopeptide transport system permease protein
MIFGVPGMGKEFVQSALNRDYGLAMGLVLIYGSLLILFNLIVDVMYAFLDPRIRHG